MDTVLNCLVTDSVGPGEYLDRFQKAARESFGFEACLAVRSPAIALGLALESIGLTEGDAVAVPAVAPAYYEQELSARKLVPVFVDLRPDSADIDFSSFAALEPKPKALILYEALGIMPDPEEVESLGITVIEDMSEAIGAYRNERRAGSLGQLVIVGLEHGSLVTSGGGALLAAHARREAPVIRSIAESLCAEYRMTDYNAALGLAQLRDMESVIAKRRELATLCAQSIARTRHKLVTQGGEGEPGYWAFPVALESSVKEVRAYAKKKDIETASAFEDSVLSRGSVPEGMCPNARSLAMRCVLFPVHQRVGGAGAQKISKVLATLP
jgi:dTDP-4-amino-4,6-dideoxygalactose transaminase